MQSNDQARYRIRLAEGFLGEARQALNSAESAVSLAKQLVDTD